MPEAQKKQAQLKINFPDRLQGGVYANNTVVRHTKEEFIIDFLMVAPPAGAVTARVVTSPGHMKRIISAFHDNLKKYERAHGTITVAKEPKGTLGFQPSGKE